MDVIARRPDNYFHDMYKTQRTNYISTLASAIYGEHYLNTLLSIGPKMWFTISFRFGKSSQLRMWKRKWKWSSGKLTRNFQWQRIIPYLTSDERRCIYTRCDDVGQEKSQGWHWSREVLFPEIAMHLRSLKMTINWCFRQTYEVMQYEHRHCISIG